MNIKLISKALHTLSLLSDEDVAIVFGLRSASEDERMVLMTALEPNTKPSQKKSSKKTARVPPDARCIGYPPGSVSICGLLKKDLIHHSRTAAAYHEFIPPQTAGKSKRASGMAAQLNKSLESQRKATANDDDDDENEYEHCQADRGEGRICYLLPDHNIHHLESAMGYHPFVSYASRAAGLSQATSSETQREDASTVHHAGG